MSLKGFVLGCESPQDMEVGDLNLKALYLCADLVYGSWNLMFFCQFFVRKCCFYEERKIAAVGEEGDDYELIGLRNMHAIVMAMNAHGSLNTKPM